ncbi:MAG TPA: hypothetical protein VNJ01_14290 [Bacteriovoracaceae bacterium]|nr:hypothetical protein [Bacteriovoracaceae bacterium]
MKNIIFPAVLLALTFSTDSHSRKGQPSQILESAAVSGEVIDIHLDNFDGTSELHRGLETPTGAFRILSTDPAVGSQIEVTSSDVSEGVMSVNAYNVLDSAKRPRDPNGQERILAVRVKWGPEQETPCSETSIATSLFGGQGSITHFFSENSRGQLNFTGNVHPQVIEIDSSPSACDYPALASRIDGKLAAAGVVLADYQKLMYFVPSASCGWSGIAFGNKRNFIYGGSCAVQGILAHELGHNLGLHHAWVPGSEYGDTSDVMGRAFNGLLGFNAINKDRLDWIYPDEVNQVAATAGLSYAVAPSNSPYLGSITRTIVVNDPELPIPLYLSYRQPLGYDQILSPIFFNQLSIHSGSDTFNQVTTLLATIPIGGEFQHPSGVKIKLNSLTESEGSVQVTKGCVKRAPVISGELLVRMKRSASRQVSASIKNNNNAQCAPVTYSLQFTAPAGVTGTYIPASLTLRSGEEQTVQLQLTTDVQLFQNLKYTIRLLESEVQLAQREGTIVFDETSPPVPFDLFAQVNSRCQFVDLFWDTTHNGDTNGYQVFKNGTLLTSVQEPNYQDRRLRRGAYRYKIRAFDEAGNLSDFTEEAYFIIRGGAWQACEDGTIMTDSAESETLE